MGSWVGQLLAEENTAVLKQRAFVAAGEYIRANGGGTFNADGSVANLRNGYMVGGAAEEQQIPVRWEGASGYANYLRMYALKHAGVLKKEGHYLGAWVDGGILYLDVSEWVGTRKQAIGLGLYREELSIWDVAAGTAIDLDGVLK